MISWSCPLPFLSTPASCPCHFLSVSASFSMYVPFIASHFPASPLVSFGFLVLCFPFILPSLPLHFSSFPFQFPFVSPSFPFHFLLLSCQFHFLSPACSCILFYFPVMSPSFSLHFPCIAPSFPSILVFNVFARRRSTNSFYRFSAKTRTGKKPAGGFKPGNPCFATPETISCSRRLSNCRAVREAW